MAGSHPTPSQLLNALQVHSLFVYFGHGSGEQYLPLAAIRRLQGCAADLLMGCSSGRLRQHGKYGPAGAVLSYLMAGESAFAGELPVQQDCPSITRTVMSGAAVRDLLWMSVGLACAGCPAVVANLWDVTDKDIDRFSQALLQSWLKQEGSPQGTAHITLCSTIASCRAACKLPCLIGAAPVCYGLPTTVCSGSL
jgi:separase